MVLDASLLNTQHYKVWIKGKVEQSWEGVALSPTPWCSSYRKGSLRVTFDYGRQLYLLTYFYIYICVCVCVYVYIYIYVCVCVYIYIYIYVYISSPGGNTPQSTNYTATYLPSWKLSKLDEPDMQDTAGEAGTSSKVMYSYGPPHIVGQKQDDQLEHTYSSYVRIWDVALKTCQRWWMIGRSGERGSGIPVLVWHDDDDDDDV